MGGSSYVSFVVMTGVWHALGQVSAEPNASISIRRDGAEIASGHADRPLKDDSYAFDIALPAGSDPAELIAVLVDEDLILQEPLW